MNITIVPWFQKDEWEDIFKKLYSNNCTDLKLAQERIAAWSSRSHPTLPLGIEVTAAFVHAKLQDGTKSVGSNCNARTAYSIALIRFVNLVSESGQLRRYAIPVREAAAKVGIPEWIVDLRHKATHGQMPALSVLRASSTLAMEWLRLNYWEKEQEAMRDWRIDSGVPVSSVDEEIKELLTVFQQHRYEVVYGRHFQGEKESKKAVQRDILQSIKFIVKKHRTNFIKRLVEPGFLIPWENHLEALLKPEETEFCKDDSTCLPHSLENFWRPVLKLFDNSKSLQVLLESLLSVHDPLAQRLAIAWVERFLKLITNDGTDYSVYASPLATTFRCQYALDWLPLLKVGLKSPNKYSPNVLACIIQQIPHLCDSRMGHSLMALTAIYLGITMEERIKIGGNSQTIYTVADLATVRNVSTKTEKKNSSGPWKVCANPIDWSKYPIGVAPDSDFMAIASANSVAETSNGDCASKIHSLYRENSVEDKNISDSDTFTLEDSDCMDLEEISSEKPQFTFTSITAF